jgi:streptogramin lyase
MNNLALRLIAAGSALCLLSAAEAQSIYNPYSFTTFAGNPPGTTDAVGSAARFDGPFGATIDADGNIYVADANNNTIRKVTSGGSVTTLAGSPGQEGSDDGLGSAARFFGPKGVTVDSGGNVYVADSLNDTIRKITPAGLVSTLAGLAGVSGSEDGTGGVGGTARFNFPTGVAVDGAGNVYVADNGNNTIRQITPDLMVTTVAGSAGVQGSADGVGSAALFHAPGGIAVDGSGHIYVVDSDNQTLRKLSIDTDGLATVTTLAGLARSKGSADGTGDAARFNGPVGVAADAAGSFIYVADGQNDTVRKVTANGTVTTLAGAAGLIGSNDGIGGNARFFKPKGITVDSHGFVYVADTNNNTIRRIDSAGVVSTFVGFAGSGSENGTGKGARFSFPTSVAVTQEGNLYVADTTNDTIRKITPAGVVTTFAGSPGESGSADGSGSAARFYNPSGVAVDSDGNAYVGDTSNDTIRKITPGGMVTTFAGTAGVVGSNDGTGADAQFNQPTAVAVDTEGNVYVADSSNDTIRKITPDRMVTTLAGSAGMSGFANGTGSNARFYQPQGIAVDQSGTVYVGDTNNNTIRKITSDAVVTTLAGLGLVGNGSIDATGTAARFFHPKGVALDAAGNVYVADSVNHTIRKVTPAGATTTLAGSVGRFGGADGTGIVARFHFPTGIAIDNAGTLYVADSTNNTIRFGVATPPVITSPPTASGIVGLEFAYQFTASGATSLTHGDLPAGFTFDPATSAIVGTPTAAGTFSIELSATNALGTTSATLTLTIQPPPNVETGVVTGTGVTGSIGNPFSFQVKASSVTGSAMVTAQGLPAGLAIDAQTGLITGTLTKSLVVDNTSDLVTSLPAPDGSSLVSLVVNDGVSTTTSKLQLIFTSDPAVPIILSPTQVNVTSGQSFTYKIAAVPSIPDPAAGQTTYSFAGTLPLGLEFDAQTGTISGTYTPSVDRRVFSNPKIDLAGGALNIVGSVQLFARNARGAATIPLLFTNAPPGAGNVSTRLTTGTNDDVLIGGFIATGNAAKKMLIRALGPSLQENGTPLPGTLADPTLEVHFPDGSYLTNDNWRSDQEVEINATGIPPPNDLEPAILATLEPANYTAIVRGKNGSTGTALIEVYDLGSVSLDISQESQLANISTRGKVDATDPMIGGFIIGGSSTTNVLVRAIGPELAAVGITDALQDPALELHDDNGALLAFNDNWTTDQESQILLSGLPPGDVRDAAIYATLEPGSYTAVVRGKDGSAGVALVEAYVLP